MADDPLQTLALEFRAGDREAFVLLVEELQDRFFRVAYRITHDHDSALDVAQDSLVKIHDRIERWDGESRFTSWAYRLVTNVAIDLLRRQKREAKAREARAQEQPEALDDRSEANIVAEERAELVEQVKSAVEALPPGQRAIVALRHYEGCSLKEIAEVRGCALGTVKSTLHQAFRSLRRSLGSELLERAAAQ